METQANYDAGDDGPFGPLDDLLSGVTPEPAPYICHYCGYWGAYSEHAMLGRCFGLSLAEVGENQFRIVKLQGGIHPITSSGFSCGEWKSLDNADDS